MKRAIVAGLTYFALVFGTGFLLGAVRVPFLVPRLGTRTAELLEMPVMLVAIAWAARFIVRRCPLPNGSRLAAGFLALACLVGAELLLATVIQDQSLAAYIASRDPVSGSVYLVMLGVFALMPRLLMPVPSK